MKKHKILIVIPFTIAITCVALYFQWGEFYKGFGFDSDNLAFSILFLITWAFFSSYFGFIQEKKYEKFFIVYWGINIISAIFIWIFANNTLVQSLLTPFYIWYGGPLYGFRYIPFAAYRANITVPTLILVTSPLGILSNFIGYFMGFRISNFKRS